MGLGAFAYLNKPVGIRDLMKSVHSAGRRGGPESGGGKTRSIKEAWQQPFPLPVPQRELQLSDQAGGEIEHPSVDGRSKCSLEGLAVGVGEEDVSELGPPR